MAAYVKDNCPVCGCAEYGTIGKILDKEPPVPVPDGSAIVKCKNCRLIYVNPMPYWDTDDYARLYNEEYFAHLKSDEQKRWFEVRESIIPRKRFNKIASHINSPKKKMLEIGAGENAFMCRYLVSMDWDVTAQEPTELFANKLLNNIGIKVETKGIIDLDGEYSLIFADSVLEHVPDPIVYYQKLASLLTPGGVLYTISPNERSMYNFLLNLVAKLKKNTPHYIAPYSQPYHLVGYTREALEILGQKSGLTLLSYKKADDYMAFHALSSKKNPLVRYPLALLYAVSDNVGLGTNGEALFVKEK
ncbi:MAG: class I SAM-dependent methyltransferase [Oscillospiraceae bacterium]|jgi:2-polyprenyl-3-methyl-5-hydroxy-6-metoxy-1,4-benzoquinol methylase|nr:class I SAM-dependent methyltransferase [Oscillospiraceae bacterium]